MEATGGGGSGSGAKGGSGAQREWRRRAVAAVRATDQRKVVRSGINPLRRQDPGRRRGCHRGTDHGAEDHGVAGSDLELIFKRGYY